MFQFWYTFVKHLVTLFWNMLCENINNDDDDDNDDYYDYNYY